MSPLTINRLAERLSHLYDTHETRSIVRLLCMDAMGLSFTEICGGALERLTDSEATRLEEMMQRLEKGEPLQYVTGQTTFLGRNFHVAPGVLIPRPETEELCEWIRESTEKHQQKILDVGTGSGCIAITLSLELPYSNVTAWDISSYALEIARRNAETLKAKVVCEQRDALHLLEEADTQTDKGEASWDVIVSNPPYICTKEAAEMHSNVLLHEPHLALFVPDDDPLLFYRHIAAYAAKTLKPNGMLFFELNPIYADELHHLLASLSFAEIQFRNDAFGKQRMVRATRII